MIRANAKKLVLLRVTNGWSKAELARKSGLVPSTIAKIEQGSNVSPKAAKKIADALRVDISEIFTITNE